MTNQTDYRSQARAVRSSAREALLQLRAERVARRRDLVAEDDGDRVVHTPHIDSCTHQYSPDMTIPDVAEPPTAGVLADMPPQDVAVTPDDDLTARPEEIEAAKELAVLATEQRAGPVEESDQSVAEVTEKVSDQSNDATQQEERGVSEEVTASDIDLSRLPGAGIGLIWMLRECGIHSLADLAAADADALSAELGVVGQILNVQTWIDFAASDEAVCP